MRTVLEAWAVAFVSAATGLALLSLGSLWTLVGCLAVWGCALGYWSRVLEVDLAPRGDESARRSVPPTPSGTTWTCSVCGKGVEDSHKECAEVLRKSERVGW